MLVHPEVKRLREVLVEEAENLRKKQVRNLAARSGCYKVIAAKLLPVTNGHKEGA